MKTTIKNITLNTSSIVHLYTVICARGEAETVIHSR